MVTRTTARLVHGLLGRAVLGPVLRYEYRRGLATYTERLVWYKTALDWLIERYPETVLDVGPGPSAWPHLLAFGGIDVTAVDNMVDPWHHPLVNRFLYFNRHWYVRRLDITHERLGRQFDVVTCLSVLELIDDYDAAVAGLFAHVKPGGFVILSIPYNHGRFIEDAYRLPDAGYGRELPYPCRQYSSTEIDRWSETNGARVIDQHFYRCFTGEFWTMGERLKPPLRVSADKPHHMSCILFQKHLPAQRDSVR